MLKTHNGDILRNIQTLLNVGTIGGLTDGQLLERFITRNGEAAELAFAALVERHGPMVLRVCQSVLREPHDAQDAFQATFLILVHKACSIRNRDSLASWLYGVACRTAACARAANARRQKHERKAAANASTTIIDDGLDDLTAVIHEELKQLPEKYRAPIVLCHLESLTHEQAAQKLRWPVGTVRSRLARGRDQLRGRLVRRGLVLSAGFLDGAVLSKHALAAFTPALANLAVRVAMRYASTRLVRNGISSASVSLLLEGVIKMMFITKLKCVVVASTLIATGAVVVAQQSAQTTRASARPAVPDEPDNLSASPPVPGEKASDSIAVARELHRMDVDLLTEEVEQLRREVVIAMRYKLAAERQHAGTASEGQPKDLKAAESAFASARALYLAKSRELRAEQRRLEQTTEPPQTSPERTTVALTSGHGPVEDRRMGQTDPHPIAASIGSIDIAAVMVRYEKAQQTTKDYAASRNAEKDRLNELLLPIKELQLQIQKVAPGSSDFIALERRIASLRRHHASEHQLAENEFDQRQSKTMNELLREIRDTTASIAKTRGLSYVVKVSPSLKPDSGLNDVIAVYKDSVVYSDPRNDLTEEVIRDLNQKFRTGAAKTPKAP